MIFNDSHPTRRDAGLQSPLVCAGDRNFSKYFWVLSRKNENVLESPDSSRKMKISKKKIPFLR